MPTALPRWGRCMVKGRRHPPLPPYPIHTQTLSNEGLLVTGLNKHSVGTASVFLFSSICQ